MKSEALHRLTITISHWRMPAIPSSPMKKGATSNSFPALLHKLVSDEPDSIVAHIMSKYPYHEEGHREAKFALSVAAFAHYCAVTAMWVYVGVIVPHKASVDKGKEAEEKKKKKGGKKDDQD